MTKSQLDLIYDVLVAICGALEADRSRFINAHIKRHCNEWRFIGRLGFGGKFYSHGRWRVGCYKENLSSETEGIINSTNAILTKLWNFFKEKSMLITNMESIQSRLSGFCLGSLESDLYVDVTKALEEVKDHE